MGSDSRAQNAGRKTNYLVSGHLQPCPKIHSIKSNWKPKVTAHRIQLSSAAVDCTLFLNLCKIKSPGCYQTRQVL